LTVELNMLGVGGGWARPGGAACGYLVRHQGFNLWIDAGTGTMANLQRYTPLEQVHAVAVSHQHFDHFLDLYPFWLSRWWGDGEKPDPIPLFAPPGMFEHALKLEPKLGDAFRLQEVVPGSDFEAGPFRVHTASMNHPVPTLGMRIESDGAALAYSADTGPTEELVELARNADLLLCEATWLDVRSEWAPIHLTATQAGHHAASAGVGRLVLTHIWPATDRGESEARASEAFGGPVTIAEEGLRLDPSRMEAGA
jgi:ribonuclease BN (tRNA processing enzyme)